MKGRGRARHIKAPQAWLDAVAQRFLAKRIIVAVTEQTVMEKAAAEVVRLQKQVDSAGLQVGFFKAEYEQYEAEIVLRVATEKLELLTEVRALILEELTAAFCSEYVPTKGNSESWVHVLSRSLKNDQVQKVITLVDQLMRENMDDRKL